jgi:hypothetical protein
MQVNWNKIRYSRECICHLSTICVFMLLSFDKKSSDLVDEA